ncbi:MAG TPA: cytochrome c oxidase assembly protein [Acidimicrobiales bacterium]
MRAGAVSHRSPQPPTTTPVEPGRLVLGVLAVALLVACLVPPLATSARRYEFAEALQFALLAVVVPVLLVLGMPWRVVGLAAPRSPDDEGIMAAPASSLRPIDRLALGRRHHPEVLRSVAFAALFLAGVVAWRVPPSVDALARHPWLAGVEAATLLIVGVGLWLELVESPPLVPRLSRPHRVALAAVCMWTIWVLAYLVGLSHVSWYHAYAHHPGAGLSLSADQQLTTGTMWLVSGCAFIPVIFWNLIRWLQSEEDPDEEMHRLVRQVRARERPLDHGQTGQ